MQIYKIRAWVNARDRKRGQYTINHPYRFEEVVTKRETAIRIFEEQRAIVRTQYEGQYRNESVKVECFVPHRFDDGTLAYWPDNGKYIRVYNPNNLD